MADGEELGGHVAVEGGLAVGGTGLAGGRDDVSVCAGVDGVDELCDGLESFGVGRVA